MALFNSENAQLHPIHEVGQAAKITVSSAETQKARSLPVQFDALGTCERKRTFLEEALLPHALQAALNGWHSKEDDPKKGTNIAD